MESPEQEFVRPGSNSGAWGGIGGSILKSFVPNAAAEAESLPGFEAAEQRAELLDLSFDAIIVRDAQDRVVYWNRGAERMYGWSRGEILGRVTHEIFQTEFPEPLTEIREKLLSSGRWTGELKHQRRDGSQLIVATRWALQQSSDGRTAAILESNTDITEHKEAEDALRRREEELEAFFQDSPLGLLWVSPDGCILKTNEAGLNLFGCGPEQVEGQLLSEFISDPNLVSELLCRLSGGRTIAEYRARLRGSGGLRDVLIDANGWWKRGQLVYSRWFVRDITLRLELEQEILAISEREQRRIGHDLHDDLCQQLTGIEFVCQSLAAGLSRIGRPEAGQVKEIGNLVRGAMARTRDLARGLSPMFLLDEEGMMVALRELALRTEELYNISCRFLCAGRFCWPDTSVVVHFYRIAQEAVGNAVKHSGAEQIEIRLVGGAGGLSLTVTDDGIGLPSADNRNSGMGLRIMGYRAEILGAKLAVERNPNSRGTRICCELATERAPQP